MDRVEQIKAEIERRAKHTDAEVREWCSKNPQYATFLAGWSGALRDLIPFINSLSEEKKPDCLQNLVNDYLKEHRHDVLLNPFGGLLDFATIVLQWQKEQINKEDKK